MYAKNQTVYVVDIDIFEIPKNSNMREMIVWKIGREYVYCRYPYDTAGNNLVAFNLETGLEKNTGGYSPSKRVFPSRDDVYDTIDRRNGILALAKQVSNLRRNKDGVDLDILDKVCALLGVTYPKENRSHIYKEEKNNES